MLHIITPFSRIKFKKFYIDNLKSKQIVWHPIVTDESIFIEKFDWLQPYYFKDNDLVNNIFNPNVIKINKFIKSFDIIDEDRYCFFNDDDWMEEELPLKLEKYNDDVIFIAMERGDQIPENANIPHGTSTLYPHEGVGIGGIGFEQIFVKGHILKQMTFLDSTTDKRAETPDGAMAEWLQENFKVRYVSNIYSYFNFLERGRWVKPPIPKNY